MAASGQKGMYVNMNSGAVQAYLPPFRNALINGDMRINQRGTSTNLASLTAVATATPGSWVTDRWNVYRPGFAAGASIGQGTGMVYADMPFADAGIATYGRIGRTAANTATTAIYCDYNMESQDSYRLVGKQVTLSFYYRNGVNFSDNFLTATLYSGTGTDQPLRSGTFTSFATTAFAKSSSWVRATVTGTVPTSAAQVCLRFSYTPVGTAGNADSFDVTGLQLELGSVATPFEVRPYPVELGLCQRYCFASPGVLYGAGHLRASNIIDFTLYIPYIPRRTNGASDLQYTSAHASTGIYDLTTSGSTITSIGGGNNNGGHNLFIRFNVVGPFTAGYAALCDFTNLIINFEI